MFCHGLQTNQLLGYLQPTVYKHAYIILLLLLVDLSTL